MDVKIRSILEELAGDGTMMLHDDENNQCNGCGAEGNNPHTSECIVTRAWEVLSEHGPSSEDGGV